MIRSRWDVTNGIRFKEQVDVFDMDVRPYKGGEGRLQLIRGVDTFSITTCFQFVRETCPIKNSIVKHALVRAGPRWVISWEVLGCMAQSRQYCDMY